MFRLNKSNFNRINKRILLTCLYLFPSLVIVDTTYFKFNTSIVRSTGYAVVCFLFIVLFLKENLKRNGKLILNRSFKNKTILIIWIFFSVMIILSEIYNGVFPIDGLYYLYFVPIVLFLAIPIVLEDSNKEIVIALFYASFIFIVFSLIKKPVIFGKIYQGVTYNPNSLGYLAAQSTISSFYLLLINYNKKNKLGTLGLLLSFLMSIMLVILSNSRTSFLVTVLCILSVFLLFAWSKEIRLRRYIKFFVIGIALYFGIFKEWLELGIFSKFRRLSSSGNILNSRNLIWKQIIDDITILGHGEGYDKLTTGKGAHNTVLGIVSKSGAIAALFLLVFFILILYYSFIYFIKRKGKNYSMVPLIVSFMFILFSLTESMLGNIGKGITPAFFNIIGVLIFHSKSEHT